MECSVGGCEEDSVEWAADDFFYLLIGIGRFISHSK